MWTHSPVFTRTQSLVRKVVTEPCPRAWGRGAEPARQGPRPCERTVSCGGRCAGGWECPVAGGCRGGTWGDQGPLSEEEASQGLHGVTMRSPQSQGMGRACAGPVVLMGLHSAQWGPGSGGQCGGGDTRVGTALCLAFGTQTAAPSWSFLLSPGHPHSPAGPVGSVPKHIPKPHARPTATAASWGAPPHLRPDANLASPFRAGSVTFRKQVGLRELFAYSAPLPSERTPEPRL